METRFAPLHSAGEGLTSRQAVEAVLDGLKEAEEICHVRYGVIDFFRSRAYNTV